MSSLTVEEPCTFILLPQLAFPYQARNSFRNMSLHDGGFHNDTCIRSSETRMLLRFGTDWRRKNPSALTEDTHQDKCKLMESPAEKNFLNK